MKKIIAVLTVLLLCLLLSGCFRGEVRMNINADQTVDVTYRMFADKMLADGIKQMQQDFQKNGFAVETKVDNGWPGFEAKKHLNSIEELKEIDLLPDDKQGSKAFFQGLQIDRGWFRDVYTLHSNLDFKGELSKNKNATEDGMTKMILSQIHLTFILGLPGSAESHNATHVENNGQVLEWDLVMGQDNQIQATAKVWNKGHVAITGIAAATVISFLVWLYIRCRKSTDSRESEAIANKAIIGAGVGVVILIMAVVGHWLYVKNSGVAIPAGSNTNPSTPADNHTTQSIPPSSSPAGSANPAVASDKNQPAATAAVKDNTVKQAQRLLDEQHVQETVLATSLGNQPDGFLSLTKNSQGSYGLVIYAKKNHQVARVPFYWNHYDFTVNRDNKPVFYEMTIFHDTQDQDSQSGRWEGEAHSLPIRAVYKFDDNGNVIPGMLTTSAEGTPSKYNRYLEEQKNVDLANLFLTEMIALQQNVKDNDVNIPSD